MKLWAILEASKAGRKVYALRQVKIICNRKARHRITAAFTVSNMQS